MNTLQKIGRLWRRIAGVLLVVLAAGCLTRRPNPEATALSAQQKALEPTRGQFGPAPAKVKIVRSDLGFVVIDFRSRAMPPVGARLKVYRGDKRVGEVQITEPARAHAATADIIEGELQAGDEAR